MTLNHRRVTAIATGQLGTVTRAQAHAAGLSDYQLRHRVQSGVLEQIGPNAFCVPMIDPSQEVLLNALVLDVGGAVWVSGPTAAALYGFDGYQLRPPFHITIRRGRDVQRVGHTIHTSRVLPESDQVMVSGFLTMRPARVLIDMARSEPTGQLSVAVESAFRDHWTSEARLRKRIGELQSPGRFGIPKLLEVLDERARKLGAHSWLEREFLRLVHEAGLPRPNCQEILTRSRDRVVRVDFRFPGSPVVVEVMGYRFHRSKRDMQRDAERLNALILDGFTPLQFTYDDVVDQPDDTIATVARALVSADP